MHNILPLFLSLVILKNEEKCFQKVKREMDFGHFSTFKKCPKTETQKKFQKHLIFSLLDHYANNYYFCVEKTVMLIFRILLRII